MRRFYNKGAKGLSGGQVKLDKMGNNYGKISGEDFAVMRSRKMGGGMMKRPMYKAGSANPKAKSKTSMKQAKAGMESQKATNKKAIKIAKTISKFNPLTIGITAADTVKRNKKMGGGMMKRNMYKAGSGKDTHVTKDGRTVKKGLYYYMNRAKKKGTSKSGKGTVTDKALKASAKTAKKPTKKA